MIGRFFGSMMFSDTPVKKLLVYVPLILLLAFVSATFVTGYNWKMGAIFTLTSALNFAFMVIGKGQPSRSLAIFALAAAMLGLLTTFTTGNIALWTVVSIGLFNSIMFPNIFALAVKDLKGSELASASGFVNSFVVGGAVVPAIMGSIADIYGYTFAYIVPAICYLYIMFYAIKGSKIRLKG
jgi:FHS family L-fucose permease-like MFS transporter